MTPLIQEPLGWLALLSRPNVLLQMGLVGVVLALTLRLPLRQTLLRRLPLGVAQLPRPPRRRLNSRSFSPRSETTRSTSSRWCAKSPAWV